MAQQATAIEDTHSEARSIPAWRLALIATFVIPLVLVAVNAQFSRLVADDYEYARVLEREGVLGSVGYWYDNWTGNYSSSFVQSAVTAMGPRALGWLLSATVIVWWAGMIWLGVEVVRVLRLPSPAATGALFGSAWLLVTVDGLPNIFDTLYWAAGTIAHVLPLVMLAYFLAFVLRLARRDPAQPTVMAAALLTVPYILLAAGFSTPSAAHMATVFLLLIGAFWRFAAEKRRVVLPVLAVALVTTVVALAIIAAAPGTAVRQQYFPPTPGLIDFVGMTLAYTLAFIAAELIILAPAGLLLVLLLGGTVAYYGHPGSTAWIRRHRWRLLGGAVILGGVLIAACFSTGAYAMSTYLPTRANTTPQWTLTAVIIACGYVMGATLRKREALPAHRIPRLLLVVLAVLLLLSPGWIILREMVLMPQMAAYSREWHEIDATIRAAAAEGHDEVRVPGYSFDLGEYALDNPLGGDPGATTNRYMALYYGVERIIAR